MQKIDNHTLERLITGSTSVLVRLSEDTLGYKGQSIEARWRERGKIQIDNAMKYGAIDYIISGETYSVLPPGDSVPFRHSDISDGVWFAAAEDKGMILVECQHSNGNANNRMRIPVELFNKMMEAYKEHKELSNDA